MSSLPRTIALLSAAALVAALAFAGRRILVAASVEPTTHVIHAQGMVFRPQSLEISPGDSVTWINDDIVPHAIKSTDPKQPWQSPDLRLHGSWTRQFQTACTYVCPYHPTMTGEIVVPTK